MPTRSNDNGRALEWCLCNELKDYVARKGIPFIYGPTATTKETGDRTLFRNLPTQTQKDFKEFCKPVIRWIEGIILSKTTGISVERFTDQQGVAGDVTDVLITSGSEELRLSVKSHHDALKHQRIPRLPAQCGINDPNIEKRFLEAQESIWNTFLQNARRLIPGATKFSQLKRKDHNFINQNLYIHLNQLVIGFLQRHANTPKHASAFFRFITGTQVPFFVLKNEVQSVIIKDFSSIPAPTTFAIDHIIPSTFIMVFDNRWRISFRLHTASTSFIENGHINASTKYDVQLLNQDEVIHTESLPK